MSRPKVLILEACGQGLSLTFWAVTGNAFLSSPTASLFEFFFLFVLASVTFFLQVTGISPVGLLVKVDGCKQIDLTKMRKWGLTGLAWGTS